MKGASRFVLVLQTGKIERARQHSGNLERHAEMLINGVGWSSPARHVPREPPAGGVVAPAADKSPSKPSSERPATIPQVASSAEMTDSSLPGM